MNIDFKKFRKDLKEAVKLVEEQYGIIIDPGNISYTTDYFTMKVTCKKKKKKKNINENVIIEKDNIFTKITGRLTLVVEEVNGDNIKLYKRGNRARGFYTITKTELLKHFSKLNY